jgi:ParB/RepB/Spo0J family partition protein
MFGDVAEAELAALVESMSVNGLQTPIEITPDGVIITGHQRVRAAKRLGWTTIDVVIRTDLAEQGPAAIEARFIEDNFVRRQLSPLARARCIQRLMEIEEGRSSSNFGPTKKEQLKARIAEAMGLSVRSVNRYLLILDAPPAIQTAFDSGTLSLTVAGQVALQKPSMQAEIARRIEQGEKPNAVVSACMSRDAKADDAAHAFRRLVGAVAREMPLLRGQLDHISPGRLVNSKSTLRAAIALFQEAITVAKTQKT